MTWNQALGPTEYMFIAVFVGFYLLYFARTLWTAQRLRTTARSVALKVWLRSGAFALLIMALLDPSFGEIEKDINASGKDVYLLVDVSRSMDAQDVQPSRLEKVKFELLRFVEQYPSNRFGLIVFSSEAYLHCPLTFDTEALSVFLESLSTNLVTNQTTDLTPALELALEKHLGNSAASNTAKLVVLFSDGENFGEVPNRLIREIRRYGISLFIVGIGSPQGGRIPTGQGPLRDSDGRVVVSRLDASSLRNIALQVQGSYFEMNERRNDSPELAKAMERVSGRLIDRRKIQVTANRYYYFLWIALFLLIIDVVVTVRTLQL